MSRNRLYFTLFALLTVALMTLDLLLGSVKLSPAEIARTLAGGGDETSRYILFNFRIPKSLVALLAGAALSASGLQMQTLFRNPLAGPYVLGVSSGASLGVSLFVLGAPLVGLGATGIEWLRNIGMAGSAWLGAAAILTVTLAVTVRIKDIMAILILGMVFGSATSAIVELMQFLSPEGLLKSYVIWTMGSLGGVSTGQLYIMAPVIAVGLTLSVALIKPLNIMLLGENYARTMGLNIAATRRMVFIGTTLLAGTVTAFCGPIGFIGVAAPHVSRMIFRRADHRTLTPASMLVGAAAMLLCDIVSQLPGTETALPINTITALLGIPIVVIVIVRNRNVF
ncbi:MAG: iron ABC transporter permease [Rikenellaceae bacterium]|jgi:iron complex transport system permease protein|nr:iron ABC transporter permease [Rikenellaceae bacterium]